jgi:hypothetical protein
MKKLIIIQTVLIGFIISLANNGIAQTDSNPISTEKSIDENIKITEARTTLVEEGYSEDMIDNLFGYENFFFPMNENVLATVTNIVDILIENNFYEESDKSTLMNLANSAYEFYNYGPNSVDAKLQVNNVVKN